MKIISSPRICKCYQACYEHACDDVEGDKFKRLLGFDRFLEQFHGHTDLDDSEDIAWIEPCPVGFRESWESDAYILFGIRAHELGLNVYFFKIGRRPYEYIYHVMARSEQDVIRKITSALRRLLKPRSSENELEYEELFDAWDPVSGKLFNRAYKEVGPRKREIEDMRTDGEYEARVIDCVLYAYDELWDQDGKPNFDGLELDRKVELVNHALEHEDAEGGWYRGNASDPDVIRNYLG